MNTYPMRLAMVSLLLGSWLILFGPLYLQLWQTHWQEASSGHVPLLGLLILALLWQQRRDWLTPHQPHALVPGCLLLISGLWLAHAGIRHGMPLPAMMAQLLVFAGILLLSGGWLMIRQMRFVLLLLCFTLPLPPYLLYALTAPLKNLLSSWAVWILHEAGYSIAHHGVVIVLDQYQLLLADACSGLHSLISLTVLALIYQHLCRYSWPQTLWLLLLILPVTLLCNLIRLLILLITTHSQGIAQGLQWHAVSGLATFALSGLLLLALSHAGPSFAAKYLPALPDLRRKTP